MLDDTCYFIGFDTLIEAEITWVLLNKEITQNFIQSIAFKDAKRMITKDLLMRIDLNEIIKETNFQELKLEIPDLNIIDWENYKEQFTKQEINKDMQLNLFNEQALHTTKAIRNAGKVLNMNIVELNDMSSKLKIGVSKTRTTHS